LNEKIRKLPEQKKVQQNRDTAKGRGVEFNECGIMPNHVHCIFALGSTDIVGAGFKPAQPGEPE
jgi:REP element-mobilizing transposase RayT